MLEKMLAERSVLPSNETMDIIELDELYTQIKKNKATVMQYGLLILEEKSVLLLLS
jgi:hypothetical protein